MECQPPLCVKITPAPFACAGWSTSEGQRHAVLVSVDHSRLDARLAGKGGAGARDEGEDKMEWMRGRGELLVGRAPVEIAVAVFAVGIVAHIRDVGHLQINRGVRRGGAHRGHVEILLHGVVVRGQIEHIHAGAGQRGHVEAEFVAHFFHGGKPQAEPAAAPGACAAIEGLPRLAREAGDDARAFLARRRARREEPEVPEKIQFQPVEIVGADFADEAKQPRAHLRLAPVQHAQVARLESVARIRRGCRDAQFGVLAAEAIQAERGEGRALLPGGRSRCSTMW